MLKRLATGCFGLVLLVSGLTAANAEKRVALVIGNSAYDNTAKLKNPSNDAADMAEALRALDFEVIDGTDLRKREMVSRIRSFANALDGADIGLFYYAGHGLQVDGRNLLAPVDATLKSDTDLDFEAIELDLVLKQLERNARVSLVFLDACRDNPLARSLIAAGRSLNVGRGLAQVEKPVGMMIAFATQPGNVALDGEGRNSPFTKALLTHIHSQDASINDVMINVRRDVLEATKGKQVPWENSSLTGQFYFNPSEGTGASAAQIAALRDEIARLKDDRDTTSSSETSASREIAVEPAGNNTSDKDEIEMANLDPALTDTNATADDTETDEATTLDALNRDIQARLKDLGCYTGRIDGDWGRGTRGAVERFNTHAKSALNADEAEQETLDTLDAWTGAPCPKVVVSPKAKPKAKTAKPKAAPKTYAKPKAATPKRRIVRKPTLQRKSKDGSRPRFDIETDTVHRLLRPAR